MIMLIVSLFYLSKTQNYMFLLQFYRQEKNQNFLAKDLKDFLFFLYWNEYKTKNENKNTTNEYRYILESNFTGINRLFTLVYLNRNNDVNQFDPRRYYIPKGIIKNYNVIINGKKLLWSSNWFWYKKIWRNYRINNRARWRLYYWIFTRSWLYQKPL